MVYCFFASTLVKGFITLRNNAGEDIAPPIIKPVTTPSFTLSKICTSCFPPTTMSKRLPPRAAYPSENPSCAVILKPLKEDIIPGFVRNSFLSAFIYPLLASLIEPSFLAKLPPIPFIRSYVHLSDTASTTPVPPDTKSI